MRSSCTVFEIGL